MKKCYKCNATMQDDDIFCSVCGAKNDGSETAQDNSSLFMKYSGYLDNESLYNVALAKEKGIVKSEFPGEAEELYKTLSIKGHQDSMFRYAMILLGRNDEEMAISWLRKAAAAGHEASKNYLDVYYGGKGTATTVSTQPAPNPAGNAHGATVLSGEEVYAKLEPSVVEIIAGDDKGSARASGFVVSTTGFVVTNAHAVLDEKGELYPEIYVKHGENVYKGKVLAVGKPSNGKDDTIDIALIFIGHTAPDINCVEFGDSTTCSNGQKVYLIGNSLGSGICITSGIVSDATREMGGLSYPYIMTDAAANHGNSGGPLLNERGEVIGVLVAGIESAEGMNFAIPINVLKEFLLYVMSETKIQSSAFGELAMLTNAPTNMKFQWTHIFTGIKLAADVISLILNIIL